MGHLIPDAPERVVGEELHYIPRRKELVTHGQLAATAWGGRLVAHFLTFGRLIVVLVDPTDGLIFAPHSSEFGRVKDSKKSLEARSLGPEHRRHVSTVEEDLHFG